MRETTVGAALCGRPRWPTLCFDAGAATEGRPYSYISGSLFYFAVFWFDEIEAKHY